MTIGERPKYQMTLSLNVLKHLGFGLYSNVPAVLSEVVANAWDADAERVVITIDSRNGRITIEDDGHGMTVDDANERYLHVGYERRKAPGGSRSPRFDRAVMGRKGIGKLSLFSIAKTVEVQSVKGSERHGFIMDADEIERVITRDGDGDYPPAPIPESEIGISTGTRIVLTNVKRRLYQSSSALRRRLARRFSVIGVNHRFEIELDGRPVTIDDRDYYDKLQYMWTFGERGREAQSAARNLDQWQSRPETFQSLHDTYTIGGWIGTARESGQLKELDNGESINKIVVMVRGKLAQEDILEEFGEAGIYSRYVLGEIHADFLDLDDEEDIATTSRQRIIEDDPRYRALKAKLLEELKVIQREWTDLRNEGGREVAVQIPQISEWYGDLSADHKRAAEKLFGRINQLPIDDSDQKRHLFVSGILAFENLRFRSLVHRLDELTVENLWTLGDVFSQLDDLEASAYYQISRDRLEVIGALTRLVDENAKERALQEHLYKHLWLLDPSWERATHTQRMETQIARAFDEVYDSLTDEQRRSRLDIRYTTTGNKHVIVELKRANRHLDTGQLVQQIIKYRTAVARVLESQGRVGEPLEFICVVGRPLTDWSSPGGREVSADTLEGTRARVVMYDELIENAQQAYRDYLSREEEAGRVYRLITSISTEDIEAMSPASE